MSRSTRRPKYRHRCDYCAASSPVVTDTVLLDEAAEEIDLARWEYDDDDGYWCGCINCGDCLGHDPPDVSRWLPSLAVVMAA
jgi:ferredoxin